MYSTLKAGFCAGADLRELYFRSKEMEKARAVEGVRDFLERIHKVLNVIDCRAADDDCRGTWSDIRRGI